MRMNNELGARLYDLTLIIPTYNRSAHLRRLLRYYQQANMLTEFLILDSSHEAAQDENKAFVASCGDRFRHVSFSATLSVASKLFEGLGLVQTPYCAVCADDDVIFPGGLKKALDFISTHSDYVCCDGIYLNFSPTAGDIHFQVEYGSRGIDAQHPGARIFRLFQRYESMFYAVFRTHDLRDVFSFVKNIPTLHFQELFQAAGALLKGKSHRMSEFYAGRQSCDPAEPLRDKWQTFYWFADDSADFLSHYQTYREDLLRFYQQFSAEPKMDPRDFFRAMDMAHAIFFSANCPPKYFHSRLQSHWPDDSMVTGLDSNDAMESLKSSLRSRIDKAFKLGAWFLRKRGFLNDYNPPLAVEKLRSEVVVRSLNQKGWGCRVPQNLLWVASKTEFRSAFNELCQYLGSASEQSKDGKS